MNNFDNFWKHKKVFITGHTGFKGSWLCLILNLMGAKITGYSLNPNTKVNLFNLANIKNDIEKSIIADVRDYKKLSTEIKKSKCKILFHLAAQPLVRESYLHPKDTFETNVLGTLNILESIKKLKSIKSSVIITSDKVYDISKNKIYNELDPLKGIDPYSSSKVCCEHIFFSYLNSFFKKNKKQKLATVRAGNVIGGGDYSKDRLIPDIIKSIEKKKNIYIRNPNSTRPWQHVLEPLSGYILLAKKMYLNNKDVCSAEPSWNFGPNVSNCKTVNYIANYISNKTKIKITKAKFIEKFNNSETNFLRLNNQKCKKIIRWYPKWNLDLTLDKILEWNNLIKTNSPKKICNNQIKEYFKIY